MQNSDETLYAIWHNKYVSTIISNGPILFEVSINGWNPAYTPTTAEDGRMVIGSTFYDGTTTYSVTQIGPDAFENDTIFTTMSLPGTLEEINSKAFRNTKLTQVVLPDSVTDIASNLRPHPPLFLSQPGAFEDNSQLTGVTIGSGVMNLGEAFRGSTNLTTITIKSGLTTIGSNAFKDLSSLKSVTLPDTVSDFQEYAFRGTGLTTITMESTVPPTLQSGTVPDDKGPFHRTSSALGVSEIRVPSASLSSYQSSNVTGWDSAYKALLVGY